VTDEQQPNKGADQSGRGRRRGAAEPQAPAQSRPSGRRAEPDAAAQPPVVRAQAKYVRSSPRKARLVSEHLRGKTVDEARAILAFTPRAVARDWSKLLDSAVANAEHNHELVGEDLRIRDVYADEGPMLRRYRPRAMGRATRIRKRTAHLTITLTPKRST
jgi:ribosomal protein L22